MKVFGTCGIDIGWCSIEILADHDGRLPVKFYEQALEKATELNLKEVSISLYDRN